MKNNINKLCGFNAIICIIMAFIPMIKDWGYFFGTEFEYAGYIVFCFRRATSGFYESEPMWKVFVFIYLVVAILMIIWAIFSLSNQEKIGKIGIIASIINLILSGFMIIIAFEERRSLIFVMMIIIFFTISSILLSFIQYKSNKNV